MVSRKSLVSKYAFISVYNKSKLYYLCSNLRKLNYKFLSTGGTYNKIKELGFSCNRVDKLTGSNEILDGRVKSIHPKIYSSILYKRDDLKHIKEFKKLNFPSIDLVIVNLYPFSDFVKKNKNKDNSIEMIDIGGQGLIRSAAKNYKHVNIIVSINDYKKFIEQINKKGSSDLIFRKKLAFKAFKTCSDYDKSIYNWFSLKGSLTNKNTRLKSTKLRYGENPNQFSYILENKKQSIFKKKIQGKDISYNNILDIDSGLNCLNEFKEPTCLIIKHTNSCGAASSENILKSFNLALESDKISSFGGVVLLNKNINLKTAIEINKYFFEVIVAKKFDKKARELFKTKSNLILIEIPKYEINLKENRSTIFGDLYQTKQKNLINRNLIKLSSRVKPNKKQIDDLIFGIKLVKYLKSNAVALIKDKQLIGVGSGHTSRIDSLKFAINKKKIIFKDKTFVCVSDGFFPFTDSIKLLFRNKCKVIAQPAGSKNDSKIKKYAIDNSISLFYIKERFFKH